MLGVHRVFTTHQKHIELAVMFENRGTLGFGWVSGQHRLDDHLVEGFHDLLLREPCIDEFFEINSPQTVDGTQGVILLGATRLNRGVDLHHVHQMKNHRIELDVLGSGSPPPRDPAH